MENGKEILETINIVKKIFSNGEFFVLYINNILQKDINGNPFRFSNIDSAVKVAHKKSKFFINK